MTKKILVFIEQREGKIKKSSFETVSLAERLSTELSAEKVAVIVGSEIENISELGSYGINKIVHLKNASLLNYSPSAYTTAVYEFAKESGADLLLFSNTSLGKDLAPRVAVRLNAGCLMDCISIAIKEGDLIVSRPVYAGKAIIEAKANSEVKVVTLRPNVFTANKLSTDTSLDIQVIEVLNPDLKTKVTEFRKSEGKLDVAEADIIVSGGRGLKAAENFKLVEDLANVLGAAVGASRAVVDAGWRSHDEQVGQTGKTVSPTLYIACGISGAIQHLAGMSSAKYIVAINKDKDAPIFNIADYGIAGDLFEILPALTEEIKKYK